MSRMAEISKNVTESTPVLAAVGAADVVVARARAAAADTQRVQAAVQDALTTYQVELRKGIAAAQSEFGKTLHAYQAELEPARLQAKVQQAPALAVSRAREVAGQVETGYAELAERGRQLVERVRSQKPTQDLIAQGRLTVNQARAAVTTARKAVDDTAAAAKGAVTIGRRETAEAVAEVEKSVQQTEQVVQTRTSGTRSAVKRTATTARNRAAATKAATEELVSDAEATVSKAVEAAEAAAEQVGD
ncbi:MAG TPA: hypothetical protein VMT69_02945 [Kineosporiaceae bacterium]|nr:hypothetical protein [Kineosporiaceae bacterium]